MRVALLALFLCAVGISEATPDSRSEDFIIQCARNVTYENDLKNNFEQLKVALDLLTNDDLKTCKKFGNHFEKFTCMLDIGIKFAQFFVEFRQNVRNNNLELAVKITDLIEDQCIRNSIQFGVHDNVSEQPKLGVIEKFMCIIRAVSKAVKDTDIGRVWNHVEKELQMILDKTRSCRSELNLFDEIRCVYIELKKATQVLIDFYNMVNQTNLEVYVRIVNNIQFCFA